MRDSLPEPWASAMVEAGVSDPRNETPSIRDLARKAGIPAPETVRRMVRGIGRTSPDNVALVAAALNRTTVEVSRWVDQARAMEDPYKAPAQADLLTKDERAAVNQVIRLLTKGREGEHGRESSPIAEQSQFTLAADEGHGAKPRRRSPRPRAPRTEQ